MHATIRIMPILCGAPYFRMTHLSWMSSGPVPARGASVVSWPLRRSFCERSEPPARPERKRKTVPGRELRVAVEAEGHEPPARDVFPRTRRQVPRSAIVKRCRRAARCRPRTGECRDLDRPNHRPANCQGRWCRKRRHWAGSRLSAGGSNCRIALVTRPAQIVPHGALSSTVSSPATDG